MLVQFHDGFHRSYIEAVNSPLSPFFSSSLPFEGSGADHNSMIESSQSESVGWRVAEVIAMASMAVARGSSAALSNANGSPSSACSLSCNHAAASPSLRHRIRPVVTIQII